MNNKGFTLVEVIITLSILAILSLILIPTVSTYIDKQNQNSIDDFIKSVETATLNYVQDNKWELDWINCTTNNEETHNIELKVLVESGYLTQTGNTNNQTMILKNPVTKEDIDIENPNYSIKATYNCGNKKFTAQISEDFENELNSSL